MEKKLIKIFQKHLGRSHNKRASMYNTKKWDSLLHIVIIGEIERKFLININLNQYEKLTSYKSILDFLKKSSK